jgi:hypothetical protein
MSIALFHGSKKNVGDYLIRDSAIKLLTEIGGFEEDDIESMEMVRKELSDEQIETIEEVDAVVIAGGPAYFEDFYPGVYPSLDTILELDTPVIPLGLGWKGRDEDSFEFSDSSVEIIEEIHSRIEFSGVRDVITKRLLKRHVDNVELVGCPAWHNKLDKIGDSVDYDGEINSIAITTPAGMEFRKQFEYLMKQLSREYEDADLYCCFHRGIYRDEHTDIIDSLYHRWLRFRAERLGFETVNMAYSPEKLDLYDEIDMHIGYRVHGHIAFLTRRKPSYLIHEDGRGEGFSESVSLESDVRGFNVESYKKPINEVLSNIEKHKEGKFKDFNETFEKMNRSFQKMKKHIENIASHE